MQSTKEFMPDQLTNTKPARDTEGRSLEAECIYRDSLRGRAKANRMLVFESEGETFCQEVGPLGKAIDGSRPQRIDEMDAAAVWELV